MRQIEVLGIPITDYTAKEAVRRSTDFMSNSALEIIYLVSMKSFMEAESCPQYKEYLSQMELMVCDDVELLPYFEADNDSRREEIETSVFTREFIKRLVRSNKKILVVADASNAGQIEDKLKSVNERVEIIKTIEYSDELPAEELINDINVLEPDAIISKLPPKAVYEFVCANRASINAEVWMALNYENATRTRKTGRLFEWFEKHISKKAFDEKVDEYRASEEEADQIETSGESTEENI